MKPPSLDGSPKKSPPSYDGSPKKSIDSGELPEIPTHPAVVKSDPTTPVEFKPDLSSIARNISPSDTPVKPSKPVTPPLRSPPPHSKVSPNPFSSGSSKSSQSSKHGSSSTSSPKQKSIGMELQKFLLVQQQMMQDMQVKLAGIDSKFTGMDSKFNGMEDKMDKQFTGIQDQLDEVKQKTYSRRSSQSTRHMSPKTVLTNVASKLSSLASKAGSPHSTHSCRTPTFTEGPPPETLFPSSAHAEAVTQASKIVGDPHKVTITNVSQTPDTPSNPDPLTPTSDTGSTTAVHIHTDVPPPYRPSVNTTDTLPDTSRSDLAQRLRMDLHSFIEGYNYNPAPSVSTARNAKLVEKSN